MRAQDWRFCDTNFLWLIPLIFINKSNFRVDKKAQKNQKIQKLSHLRHKMLIIMCDSNQQKDLHYIKLSPVLKSLYGDYVTQSSCHLHFYLQKSEEKPADII